VATASAGSGSATGSAAVVHDCCRGDGSAFEGAAAEQITLEAESGQRRLLRQDAFSVIGVGRLQFGIA
jgi:hypothetical protein